MTQTSRGAALALGIGFAALALLCGFIAWEGLNELLTGLRDRPARVVVRTSAGGAVAAAAMMAAFALMLLPAAPGERWSRTLFTVALATLPFLLLLPLALLLLTPPALEARGYQRCTDVAFTGRFAAVPWCRTR